MALSGSQKIVKAGGAAASDLEIAVANELFNLEVRYINTTKLCSFNLLLFSYLLKNLRLIYMIFILLLSRN